MTVTDLEQLALVRRMAENGEARRLREEAGMSLSEVAKPCRVSTTSVWKWETGRARPRTKAGLRYLRVLEQLRQMAPTQDLAA